MISAVVPVRRTAVELPRTIERYKPPKMEVVLSTEASVWLNKKFVHYEVTLTRDKLEGKLASKKIKNVQKSFAIKISDILVCHVHEHLKDCIRPNLKQSRPSVCNPCKCMKSSNSSQISAGDQEGAVAFLTVYYYPYNKPAKDGGSRKQKEIVFRMDSKSSQQGNIEIAKEWKDKLNAMTGVNKVIVPTEEGSGDATDSANHKKRKFYVCINPFSGPGHAKEVFQKQVVHYLKLAGIDYDILVTERQYHCQEVAKALDTSKYDAVVIVSGDGLVFEWINGIMEREDREHALRLPMGIIPAGSGNALAAAMLYSKGEQYLKDCILHSSIFMAKGKPAEMDIVQIHFGQKKIYSFLAVVWGIIADIDIESEWLRFMGSPRFTIQAIIRILNPRRYRGTLSFLPIADASKYEKLFEGRKISTNGAVHNTPSVVYAEAAVQAGAGILGNGRSDLGQGDDGILNPGFDSNESSETGRQSSSSLETTSYLPALNEPVPSDWVSIKGDFVCMSAVSVSHLAANVIAWPHRDFSEGAICIQYTKYPTARKSLLGMIEAFKDGSHMKFDFVESAFVKAFRFEPSEDKGVITVDGEKIDFGPIQGEMLPWKANVLIPDDAIGS